MKKGSMIPWILILQCAVCWTSYAQDAAASEFILKPSKEKKKKLSASELKEEIGFRTKDLFSCATTIEQKIGNLQCAYAQRQETLLQQPLDTKASQLIGQQANNIKILGLMTKDLSLLHTKCSAIVEKLIDNQRPFKKASKGVLEKTHETLIASKQKLDQSIRVLSGASSTVVGQVLEDQKKILHAVYESLCLDECLKNA